MKLLQKCMLTAIMIAMTIGCSMAVNAAPKTMAGGTIFDAEFYASSNADVVQVLGNDEAVLYSHYVNYGKAEGRKPCADGAVSAVNVNTDAFDAVYYAENNPDVVKVVGKTADALYKHYLNYGKAEGRKPNSGSVAAVTNPVVSVSIDSSFDAAYYAANNPDVVKAIGNNPTVLYNHYVNHGKAEGRRGSALEVKQAPAAQGINQTPAVPVGGSGAYAVNSKNGKIHKVGFCNATGNGKQAMTAPVYFDTYEAAEQYSVSHNPKQKSRKCGNCW